MANFMGMIFNKLSDDYGYDRWGAGDTIAKHVRTESHNPDMNIGDLFIQNGSNGVVEDRNGYPEPAGDINISASTKYAPYIFNAAVGNYKFTKEGYTASSGAKLNVHEFWINESLSVPQFCAEFTYSDFMRKRIYGAVCDSLEWEAGTDLTKVKLGMIYQTEKVNKLNVDTYNEQELNAIPLVGYDYTRVRLGSVNDTLMSCFKDFKISLDNKHNTEECRCLGEWLYGFKPTMENRELKVTLNTKMDERNYVKIVNAMHNSYNPNSSGWNSPAKCVRFRDKLEIIAKPCEGGDEYIRFLFPENVIKLSPLEASNGVITAELELNPKITKTATLFDGKTSKKTSMLVQVFTSTSKLTNM